MTTASAKFDAAANAALCNYLTAAGSGAVSAVAWSLVTGGPVGWTAAAAIAGVAGLAYATGCQWDPEGQNTLGSGGGFDGCTQIDGGYGVIEILATAQGSVWAPLGTPPGDYRNVISLDGISYTGDSGTANWRIYLDFTTTEGATQAVVYASGTSENAATGAKFRLSPIVGTCGKTETPATNPPPPYVYTDPDDGCQLTVNFQGFAVGTSNEVGAVWTIEPAATLRTGGGIIGGCNFSPTLYYQPPPGGGGGGGTSIPYVDPEPPGPGGQPWWLPLVEAAIGGIVGAGVKAILDALTEESVSGKVYRLTSVCETNAAGEPVDLVREVDIPTLSILQATIYRLDAIEYLLQGLKDFKQPTCRKVTYQGQLVSVDFKSDEISPNGKAPLRKLLRYRDQTNTPLPDHVAHWEAFVWQAGPAIVIHKGAVWGVLKVWAADAEEGKRVIRHAGAIAGVDPDAEGEWEVTSSADPRYGQPGTMRIATRKSWGGQILQISKRPGPDGLPIVPCDCG